MPDPVTAEILPTAPAIVLGMDTAVVEGSIVASTPIVAANARRSQLGKREAPKAVVSFPLAGRQVDVELSAREHQFLTVFIDTMNLYAAAAEMGMDRRTARKFVQSERVKEYIAYRIRQKASAQGLTIDKVMAKLNGAIDGTDPLDEAQLAAIGHATKILRPQAAASLTINQQNNFGAGGAPAAVSPYAKMGKAELLSVMKDVVSEAAGEIPPAAVPEPRPEDGPPPA